MKVLVVDPDAARAATVADALSASGAAPAVAPCASFALTMLEWNRQDVIISRANVGDMEGHELCAMVRADPSTVGVRFVLIASGMTPPQVAPTGVDLVIPDGLVGPAIVTRVMHLMRRDGDQASPPPAPTLAAEPAPAPVVAPADALPIVAAATPAPPGAPPPSVPTPPPAPGVAPAPAAPTINPLLKGAAPPPPPLTELEAVGMNGAMRTFQGALGSLALEDLAQAIVKGGKTGRLLLVLSTGGGMIAFETGRIVHAEVANTTGETAFQSLLSASRRDSGGKFCFIPSAPRELANVPKTITRSVAELLAGAAQATNEER